MDSNQPLILWLEGVTKTCAIVRCVACFVFLQLTCAVPDRIRQDNRRFCSPICSQDKNPQGRSDGVKRRIIPCVEPWPGQADKNDEFSGISVLHKNPLSPLLS